MNRDSGMKDPDDSLKVDGDGNPHTRGVDQNQAYRTLKISQSSIRLKCPRYFLFFFINGGKIESVRETDVGMTSTYVEKLTEKDESRPHTGHVDVGAFWTSRFPVRHTLQKECVQSSTSTKDEETDSFHTASLLHTLPWTGVVDWLPIHNPRQ